MFKRVRWAGLGAVAGAVGTVWSQRALRRQMERVTPENVSAAVRGVASRSAKGAASQVSRRVRTAVGRARRTTPELGPIDAQIDLRPPTSPLSDHPPYRPANWHRREH